MPIPAIVAGLAMATPGVLKAYRNFTTKAPQQKISNDTTSYLNKLREVSKTGLYGQDVKNQISTEIETSGDKREAKLIGQSVKQGIENSGVVGQQLLQSGDMTTLSLARMAKQIAQMNEESKLDASRVASDVGQGIESINYQNALARMARKDAIYEGVGDAISGGFSAFDGRDMFNSNEALQAYLKKKNSVTAEEWDSYGI